MKLIRDLHSPYLFCKTCKNVIRTNELEKQCPRCGSHAIKRDLKRHWECLIYVLTAAILYIPANYLDIMVITQFNQEQPSTIISGIIDFYKNQYYLVGSIILFASILIPLLKILGLFFLLFHNNYSKKWVKRKTKLYHIIESIGKWSMIDIFVICIYAGLVDLGFYINVKSGSGALFFSLVVILTMIASKRFDPRFMWDKVEEDL